MNPIVTLEVKNKVGYITMNNPETLNAVDETFIQEFVKALDDCKNNDDVKVIVIQSACKAFSAGGNLQAMYKGHKEGINEIDKIIKPLENIPRNIKHILKPVIAAVNGAAAGAGASIALTCDFIVASEKAKFIQAFRNVGLASDAGSMYAMVKSLGRSLAVQLSMTARPLSAKEAYDRGIVYKLCAVEEFEKTVIDFAEELANGPTAAFAHIKDLANIAETSTFEEYLNEEIKQQTECSYTEDHVEGVASFVEKRPANYKGK